MNDGTANVAPSQNAVFDALATRDAAIAGKEPTITAGTTAQYWRGDKTWQTLGSAALLDAGTGNNNVVQLDNSGRYPAVDGSLITNLNGSAIASGTVNEAYLDPAVARTANLETTATMTLYVDPAGADTNACTSTVQACKTFNGVFRKIPTLVQHDVTIIAVGTTYNSGISMSRFSIQPGRRIRIEPSSGTITIDGQGTLGTGVFISGTSGGGTVHLKEIVVTNSVNNSILIENNRTQVYLDNVVTSNSGASGLVVSYGSLVYLQNGFTSTQNSAMGIHLFGSSKMVTLSGPVTVSLNGSTGVTITEHGTFYHRNGDLNVISNQGAGVSIDANSYAVISAQTATTAINVGTPAAPNGINAGQAAINVANNSSLIFTGGATTKAVVRSDTNAGIFVGSNSRLYTQRVTASGNGANGTTGYGVYCVSSICDLVDVDTDNNKTEGVTAAHGSHVYIHGTWSSSGNSGSGILATDLSSVNVYGTGTITGVLASSVGIYAYNGSKVSWLGSGSLSLTNNLIGIQLSGDCSFFQNHAITIANNSVAMRLYHQSKYMQAGNCTSCTGNTTAGNLYNMSTLTRQSSNSVPTPTANSGSTITAY